MTTRRAQDIRRRLRKRRQEYTSNAAFHHAFALRLQHTGWRVPAVSTVDHFLHGRPTTEKILNKYEFAADHWQDGRGPMRKKREG